MSHKNTKYDPAKPEVLLKAANYTLHPLQGKSYPTESTTELLATNIIQNSKNLGILSDKTWRASKYIPDKNNEEIYENRIIREQIPNQENHLKKLHNLNTEYNKGIIMTPREKQLDINESNKNYLQSIRLAVRQLPPLKNPPTNKVIRKS